MAIDLESPRPGALGRAAELMSVEHERIVFCRDESGLHVILSVHDTTLGPALLPGGKRVIAGDPATSKSPDLSDRLGRP